MMFRLSAGFGLLLFALTAHAVEYTRVVPAQSQVTFQSRQMGVPVDGHFKRFRAELAFDPDRPQASRVVFDVDLASIDAGSPDANGEIVGASWFDTARFQRARFVSRTLTKLDAQRYEVTGVLTLKGKSREMRIPVQLRRGPSSAVLDARFSLNRLDFGIGSGPWADTDTVANAVTVNVRLTATEP